MKIIAISGSLRKGSYTTTLLKTFGARKPENIEFELLDIGDLPLMNEDLEADLPQAVRAFHDKIASADALIFGNPEYNRSFTPVMKNVIDWGSRPPGQNKWAGKPAASIGCSPGMFGGFGAVNQIRQVLAHVGLAVMPTPEFLLSKVKDVVDGNGEITDEKTLERIDKYWEAFVKWAQRS